MYALYNPLVVFANGPQYCIPHEAALTRKIYDWLDQGVEVYTPQFHFVVTYLFDPRGIAIDANILVQVQNDCGGWDTIGNFSPLAPNPLASLMACGCESVTPACAPVMNDPCHCNDDCTPSTTPSLPIGNYFWNNCNLLWNEIAFLWNNHWPIT